MLDLFYIFSKGGLVLWSFQGTSFITGTPVNTLIQNVLLEEKGASTRTSVQEPYALKWVFENDYDLVFVAVYQKAIALTYVERLLDEIKKAFCGRFPSEIRPGQHVPVDFTPEFTSILKEVEKKNKEENAQPKAMRRFEDTEKFKKSAQAQNEPPATSRSAPSPPPAEPKVEAKKDKEVESPKPVREAVQPEVAAEAGGSGEAMSVEEKLRAKGIRKKGPPTACGAKAKAEAKATSPKAKTKQARKWDNQNDDSVPLDFSEPTKPGDDGAAVAGKAAALLGDGTAVAVPAGDINEMDYRPEVEIVEGSDTEEDSEDDDHTEPNGATPSQQKTRMLRRGEGRAQEAQPAARSGIMSFFRGLAGGETITADMLTGVLDKTKEHLVSKNVAADIAQKLCDSVSASLVGKKQPSFKGLAAIVRETLEESLVRILTPNRRIDILRDVLSNKQSAGTRPYVIVMCGVNGVGKSTNLAKITNWLLGNGLKVVIAACDTFRSGAVEQLRVHARALSDLHPGQDGNPRVLLYEKGYGKDAAAIAADGINFARDNRADVVLVDTAGRMQDNEPLMRALAKLIKINAPDLVLFVGEALVGNEAVDQLIKFNRALADFSETAQPRLIDGIILTKFDTIDDKVGAAISMTYTSGRPIVFVGTGQTYADLKRLNVKSVVQALMKS